MEYEDSEKAKEAAERTRAFMDEEVLPTEREYLGANEQIPHSRIEELREEAKERDLWGPQIPEEYGGQGLAFREILPAFEEVGRSLIGATAVRANAPDEGNIHTLEMVGTDEQ
jgi:acyl-CoA dehydrogenase